MIKGIYSLLLLCNLLNADSLESVIRNDNLISNGNLGFIEYKGEMYLVSVGRSIIKNNSIQEKINGIKKSRLKAKAKLSNFINNISIQSIEKIKNKKYSDNVLLISDNQEYMEIIVEKSSGILKNMKDISNWKINDEYFYAIGINIKK